MESQIKGFLGYKYLGFKVIGLFDFENFKYYVKLGVEYGCKILQ